MPRFFFDLDDGRYPRDDKGIECFDLDTAIGEAIRRLPPIEAHARPDQIDDRAVAVVVRNERGDPVYRAALAFSGVRL